MRHNPRVRRDLTRPIPVDNQLVRKRGWKLPFAGIVVIAGAAIAAAIFVFPFQA